MKERDFLEDIYTNKMGLKKLMRVAQDRDQ
jgi:hypothetical protein